LVPPDLSLPIQERIYDVDILSYLPVVTGTGSTFRIVKDTSTTGITAAGTAEGGNKPQLTVNYTNIDTAYVVGAVYITLTRQSISDYPQSLSVTIQRAMNDVMGWRNGQLLNGTGSGGQIQGLIPAAGSTIAVPATLPTGVTQLDYFVQAVDQMRVASGVFATPDLCFLNPVTWHSLLLIKDSLGRPLLNPMQGVATSYQIAGVPVKLSTDCPAGTACLVDTNRYGYAVVREGMSVVDGYVATDLAQNQRSWVVEWRGMQTISRSAAICTITGLETTFVI
jgi:HK97 family phage major capsid protein